VTVGGPGSLRQLGAKMLDHAPARTLDHAQAPGEVLAVPKVVLNTVRVPLSAFSGVNLNAVRSVQFTFNERLQGGVLVTDVAFASAP